MSIWINNEKIIKSNLKKTKPCHILGWCPYGCIVEEFSLDELNVEGTKLNCVVFGHHCPMFYHAEDLGEFGEKRINVEKEE